MTGVAPKSRSLACAAHPDNFIAFEYPVRFEPFWYEITEGFDGVPVATA
jgi:hypothetical protein